MQNPFKFVWKNNRVWLIVTASILAFLLTVSLLATQVTLFKNTLITLFGDYRQKIVNPYTDENYVTDDNIKTKKDALNYANSVNLKINEEGIILLKNESALPIATPVSSTSVLNKPKVSVFGKNSIDLVYGGSGSGAMSAGESPTLYDSLAESGFEINPTLKAFYESSSSGKGRPSKAPAMGTELSGYPTYETPLSMYSNAVKDSYANYSDAAIVVVSRIGGEGYDLPRTMMNTEGANATDHYLQLDNNERALIKEVGNRFEKVIVVINCSSAMELGFLDDVNHYAYHKNVKAALWIGNPGGTGIYALGKVLNGQVNPSGRTVDTYARNFRNDPTWNNFGSTMTENGNQYLVDGGLTGEYFVNYKEGIYVGYRYYETRFIEEAAANRDAWYKNNVVFPFGYGLSYTEFKTEVVNYSVNTGGSVGKNDTMSVTVKVTNTGNRAGKNTVQLYASAPYYTGGIEKAHVELAAFEKTDILYPVSEAVGDKKNAQELTLEVKVEDLASYDYSDANGNGFKGYELESGEYALYVSNNAHQSLKALSFNVADSGKTEEGIIKVATNGANGFAYSVKSGSDTQIKNRFDDVSSGISDYLSRENITGALPSAPSTQDREVTKDFIDSLSASAYIGSGRNVDRNKPWFTSDTPNFAKSEMDYDDTVKLYELRGKSYDDPLWDELLDCLTVNQIAELIGTGNFNTAGIANIMKPKTTDPDGPAGFTNFMSISNPSVYDTCFYASECVIGATWNKALAAEMGNAVGNEALIGNEREGGRPYSGWYAPAVNIHRSPFAGRNFEYYSEDGLLSGKMGAALIQAVKEKGVYTYVKHFALNDQETQRGGVCTWANEQSMREIYLEPFEIAVKEGKTTAMMSSFNRIGSVWTGGSYQLLTEVLRDEWGFRGMVITDYNTYDHMPADQMIRAGGDLNLYQDKKPSVKGGIVTSSHLTAMRNSAHNILYTVANSNAMNDLGKGSRIVTSLPNWIIIMICVDIAAVLSCAVWGFCSINKKLRSSKKIKIEPYN